MVLRYGMLRGLGVALCVAFSGYASLAADIEWAPETPALTLSADQSSLRMLATRIGERHVEAQILALPRALDGEWYAGVDLASKRLLLLPRLGHRGWIPLGRLTATPTSGLHLTPLEPKLPTTRLGRSFAKLDAGQTLNVLVLGSSLLHASRRSNTWPNLVFSDGSGPRKVGGKTKPIFVAVPGAGNAYQLAQLADRAEMSPAGAFHKGTDSTLLKGIDLVVIGTLANSGPEWRDIAERILEQLAAHPVDILIVTDNAAKAPGSFRQDRLFSAGADLISMADRFGAELADTAAYVAMADQRHPGRIYKDHIHMSAPSAGASATDALPNSGHEAWALAVASVFGERHRSAAPIPPQAPKRHASAFWVVPGSALRKTSVAATGLTPNPLRSSDPDFAIAAISSDIRKLTSGDAVTFPGHCLLSVHVVRYGDRSTPPTTVELSGGETRQTSLAGRLPFPNQWITRVYASSSPFSGQAQLKVTSGQLDLDALLLEVASPCAQQAMN